MISRFLKFAVVVLVLHAVYQFGTAYWDHYQFQDAVQQIAQFDSDKDEETVRARVMGEAARAGLPVVAERVGIRKDGAHLYIDLTYTRQIPVLPRVKKPWSFSASAHGWFVPGGQIPTRR